MGDEPSFLAELKRRKVYQTAMAYVVATLAAWGAVEIASQAFGWSDQVLQFVIIASVVGLPVALVASWLFEVRRDHGKKVHVRLGQAVAVGIFAGLLTVGMLGVTVSTVFGPSGNSEPGGSVAVPSVEIALAVEEFYSGSHAASAQRLEALLRVDTLPRAANIRVLRYLARSYIGLGDSTGLRGTLERMVAAEPPVEILYPSVEDRALFDALYDVKRNRVGSGTVATQTAAEIRLWMYPTVVLGDTVCLRGGCEPVSPFGSMGSILAGALEAHPRVRRITRALVPDRTVPDEGAYEWLDDRLRTDGDWPTHVLLSSVVVTRDGQLILTAWMEDVTTGEVVAFAQQDGSVQTMLTVPERLAEVMGGALDSLPSASN